MYRTNEEVFTRAEKTGSKFEHDSRWNRNARSESGSIGNKQERISGANSSRRIFTADGCPITGGIVRQLIKDYTSQLAHKHDEIKRIEQEKIRVDGEIVQLDCKIKEFSALLEKLEAEKKT